MRSFPCGSRKHTGYTDSQAAELISNVPVKIGDNLNFSQAQTVAQALTEYGALVSVVNGNENVDVSSTSGTSLFNSDGSFIQKALAVLSTITLANRVTSYTSYKKPSLLERIFKLPFRRKEPPKHIRRTVPRRTYVRPQNFRFVYHKEPPFTPPVQHMRPQPQIKGHTFTNQSSRNRSDRFDRPDGHRDRHDGPGRRH